MSRGQLYDAIGATYTVTRRTEPRIAQQVWAALGDARTVLNVGAGTGSYEPSDCDVIAVEPRTSTGHRAAYVVRPHSQCLRAAPPATCPGTRRPVSRQARRSHISKFCSRRL